MMGHFSSKMLANAQKKRIYKVYDNHLMSKGPGYLGIVKWIVA